MDTSVSFTNVNASLVRDSKEQQHNSDMHAEAGHYQGLVPGSIPGDGYIAVQEGQNVIGGHPNAPDDSMSSVSKSAASDPVVTPIELDDGVENLDGRESDDGVKSLDVNPTAAILVGVPTGEEINSENRKLTHKVDKTTKEVAKIGEQLQTIAQFQKDIVPTITSAVTSGVVAAIPALVTAIQQAQMTHQQPPMQHSSGQQPQQSSQQQPQQPQITYEHYLGVLLASFTARQIKEYALRKGIAKKYCSSRRTVIEQLWLHKIDLPP